MQGVQILLCSIQHGLAEIAAATPGLQANFKMHATMGSCLIGLSSRASLKAMRPLLPGVEMQISPWHRT